MMEIETEGTVVWTDRETAMTTGEPVMTVALATITAETIIECTFLVDQIKHDC